MRARPGDHLVLAAPHTSDATRDGVVVAARGPDGGPPYVVRWSDGHEALIYPGPGAVLRVERDEHRPPAEPAERAPRHDEHVGHDEHPPGHVRDWHVRVSIFERGDETDATVVLLADAPEHLRAHGHARRSSGDRAVPEIGDEVAVARALRRLADRLLDTAERDIEGETGEGHVTVRG